MSKRSIDRLGQQLLSGLSAPLLKQLDDFRRSHRASYDHVVDVLRGLGFEPSGRPAKSTSAIADKLARGSMRLSQMQDIAGCRIVVSSWSDQEAAVAAVAESLSVELADRRYRPSHGYRAVHLIVTNFQRPVEIQIRTQLQHGWAELSERISDELGHELKYGLGPAEVLGMLSRMSELVAAFEALEAELKDHPDLAAKREELRAWLRSDPTGLK